MRHVPITSSQFLLSYGNFKQIEDSGVYTYPEVWCCRSSQGETEGKERRHRLIVCRDCTLIYYL